MMKAGTQTGSLVNHLYSRMTNGQPEPVVGMGATLLSWTDRNPATITSVQKVGKFTIIGVKGDNYKRIDSNGMSENQEYEYTPNPDAAELFFRFDGKFWSRVRMNPETKRWNKIDSGGIRIGSRQKYHDFSF